VSRRRVRIATNPRLAHFDFKNAEVAQLDLLAFSQGLGDVIERFLHDIQDLLLNQSRLLTDANHQVAFCQSHIVMELGSHPVTGGDFITRWLKGSSVEMTRVFGVFPGAFGPQIPNPNIQIPEKLPGTHEFTQKELLPQMRQARRDHYGPEL